MNQTRTRGESSGRPTTKRSMGNECSQPCHGADQIQILQALEKEKRSGGVKRSELEQVQLRQQAENAGSLHSAGRVKHRMDGMQKNEAPSYLDFVSSQPDPVFDRRRQQSGAGNGKNGQVRTADGALKVAADRYCQVGIGSLIYRPAHPDYLPGGVQFGVDPLPPLDHQSAPRHSKIPRTVFSCRKNGQSSSVDSDSETEDATEDEFAGRLSSVQSSGPSPLEVDDAAATCRHLSFSTGGAAPGGMSGRRRAPANNA